MNLRTSSMNSSMSTINWRPTYHTGQDTPHRAQLQDIYPTAKFVRKFPPPLWTLLDSWNFLFSKQQNVYYFQEVLTSGIFLLKIFRKFKHPITSNLYSWISQNQGKMNLTNFFILLGEVSNENNLTKSQASSYLVNIVEKRWSYNWWLTKQQFHVI